MKAGVISFLAIAAPFILPAVASAQAPPPPPPGSYPGTGPAQPARQGVIAKGIKLGLNAGGLHGDTDAIDDEQGRRLGLGVGGYIVYAMNDQLSAQIELAYVQKGATFDDGDDVLKFDYVELPVLGRFDLGQPGGMRPYLAGGLAFALNVLGEAESNGESQELECVSDLDVLLQAGAGAAIPSGSGALTLELRLSVGMLNTVKDDPDNGCTGDGDIKNNGITVFAGYEF